MIDTFVSPTCLILNFSFYYDASIMPYLWEIFISPSAVLNFIVLLRKQVQVADSKLSLNGFYSNQWRRFRGSIKSTLNQLKWNLTSWYPDDTEGQNNKRAQTHFVWRNIMDWLCLFQIGFVFSNRKKTFDLKKFLSQSVSLSWCLS